MEIKKYRFDGSREFSQDRFDPSDTGNYTCKEEAAHKLKQNQQRLSSLQDRLYAEAKEGVLIIFQAMDAAGKDGAVKHVMSGVNPQGIDVFSFKQPSREELAHDYLWRCAKRLPERGKLCIFNRSYYEDVLVGRVHKLYMNYNLPQRCKGNHVMEQRYRQITGFEEYLWENGIRVVKFYLDISKEEQKKRFLKRIDDKSKNWKFSASDLAERQHWEEYQRAYEDAINNTATKHAPWYVVPSNKKWFSRLLISEILIHTLREIAPQYPALPPKGSEMLLRCRQELLEEQALSIK